MEYTPFRNLDSLGKEVSGFGSVFGSCKRRGKLGDDISSGVVVLADKSERSDHSKTAVLDFLELLVSIFLGRVVEVEGVPSAWVTNADVSDNTVLSLLLNPDDALELNPCHSSDNLVDGKLGDLGDGLKRVDVRVSVGSSEVLVSRERSEKSRPDESHDSKLGNTSVGELCLTKPLKIGHEVSLLVDGVVERGEGGGGESNRVKSGISGKGSVEGGGGRSEGKCTGALGPFVEGGRSRSLGGGGESSGRAEEERKSSDLHDDN
mmetsp:Transcript_20662/g.43413  ORF Transcript_20662/g.43413 Transcript_20662/m.43413 type:complete len:263 (-) Transcript_20662:85-873(-)